MAKKEGGPIGRMKKDAKRLLKMIGDGEREACERVRRVLYYHRTSSDAAITADVTLMKAQHVIAVESGYHNWDDARQRLGVG